MLYLGLAIMLIAPTLAMWYRVWRAQRRYEAALAQERAEFLEAHKPSVYPRDRQSFSDWPFEHKK